VRDLSADHAALSINTATVRKAQGREVPLGAILEACARHGIRAISPWRDQVSAFGLEATVRAVRDGGFRLSGYCRGGMFPAADAAGLAAAHDDNLRALDEACALDAACLVLVVGALPGALAGQPAHKDIARSRTEVWDGIARLLEASRERRMPLAIEPLHPMYAADRACINTLEQALDMCEQLDPEPPVALGTRGPDRAALGVAVDLYHVWWDPKLQAQIARAGARRLHAFHVCDWRVPTVDLLNDRGLPGEGVIEIAKVRGWVEAAGFAGDCEVEVFSHRWWERRTDEILEACIAAHRTAV
jgi:sugar phosphate isomerase/epimerase